MKGKLDTLSVSDALNCKDFQLRVNCIFYNNIVASQFSYIWIFLLLYIFCLCSKWSLTIQNLSTYKVKGKHLMLSLISCSSLTTSKDYIQESLQKYIIYLKPLLGPYNGRILPHIFSLCSNVLYVYDIYWFFQVTRIISSREKQLQSQDAVSLPHNRRVNTLANVLQIF